MSDPISHFIKNRTDISDLTKKNQLSNISVMYSLLKNPPITKPNELMELLEMKSITWRTNLCKILSVYFQRNPEIQNEYRELILEYNGKTKENRESKEIIEVPEIDLNKISDLYIRFIISVAIGHSALRLSDYASLVKGGKVGVGNYIANGKMYFNKLVKTNTNNKYIVIDLTPEEIELFNQIPDFAPMNSTNLSKRISRVLQKTFGLPKGTGLSIFRKTNYSGILTEYEKSQFKNIYDKIKKKSNEQNHSVSVARDYYLS